MHDVPNLSHTTLLEHQAFVLRLARSLLHDESSAQDVAQEALLVALRRPPGHGGVRSWLARVVKSRVADRVREESRRTAREALSARTIAVESASSPAEALEIQQDVVNAVLALAEPYKSVVIATYYEGLSPTEIASRQDLPAGTVRSHLHRAHELLRSSLARRHGNDALSARQALLLFVRTCDGGTDIAAASSWPFSSLVAGAATLLLALGVTWFVFSRGQDTAGTVASLATEPVGRRAEALEAAPDPRAQRTPAAAPAAPSEPVDDLASMGADDLLVRSRQLKAAILARRLTVAEADLDPRFADRSDAGVVKLIDRNVFHHGLDYPGARGSGACYSFSERVHDSDRRPQIGLESGRLRATPTETEAWILDLGEHDLFSIQTTLALSPFPADPLRTIVWETMLGPFHASMEGDMNWDMLTSEFERKRDAAYKSGRIVDADLARMPTLDGLRSAEPVVGHTYLLRSLSHSHFDIAVILTVVRSKCDECTIRWIRLEGYPEDSPRNPSTLDDRRKYVPTVPASLADLNETELMTQLERVRARADSLLFARFSAETEARYGHLRGKPGSGLVRCMQNESIFGELAREAETGASHFSFFFGKHNGLTNDLRVGHPVTGSSVPALESAADEGRAVDLGMVPLEEVAVERFDAATSEAVRFACEYRFEETARAVLFEQARSAGRSVELGPVPANSPVWSDIYRAFRRHLWSLIGFDPTPGVVGHTYLMRTFSAGETDVLAAFTIAEADRYGLVIAWRLLRGTKLSLSR